MKTVKRVLLGTGLFLSFLATVFVGLIAWPSPLFAYSLDSGRIVIASDEPIPASAGRQVIRECQALLERSPLQPESGKYHLFVTNTALRHRVFFLVAPNAGGLTYFVGGGGNAFLSGADFLKGRLVKWGYVAPPPRTLAYFCAHELTHIVVAEHLGVIASELQPLWVHEGFADYVAIAGREGFDSFRAAIGDQPVDIPMMQKYGAYPRYRLLVTYFLERRGWSVDKLLNTHLTLEQALSLMHQDNGT